MHLVQALRIMTVWSGMADSFMILNIACGAAIAMKNHYLWQFKDSFIDERRKRSKLYRHRTSSISLMVESISF